MVVIPAISGNPPATTTLDKEVDCNQSSTFTVTYPTWTPYTYTAPQIPAGDQYLGYQAVGLSSDYRPSVASTTLNATTSTLVESVDWGQCPGGTYPGGNYYGLKDIGGQGSYLAGAITEAQNVLNQNARTGATNAIVILSDGELNDPKSGFSTTTPVATRSTPPRRQRRPAPPSTRSRTTQAPRRTAAAPTAPPTATASRRRCCRTLPAARRPSSTSRPPATSRRPSSRSAKTSPTRG